MDRNKLVLADLLAEVKLAEKKLEKSQGQLPAIEARIKQALVAGKRELAKKYALEYEERKLEVKRCEQGVALAKQEYERGKARALEGPSAKSLQRMAQTAQAMNAMADSLGVLSSDDDMLRKLDEKSAVAEARLDLAIDDAAAKHPELHDASGPSSLEPPPPPLNTAEDILKEFE